MAHPSKLEQLRQMTVVVADTGDLNAIRELRPEDATTNPSLILAASQLPDYQDAIRHIIAETARSHASGDDQMADCVDRIAVTIGREILSLVPGRVSTEVDARLSFDTHATIARAQRLISLYEEHGIGRERVLIKMASTWEGIRAAEYLEREGIRCNLTLLFGFSQAVACADAGVTLISPFVGRILDWHRARQPDEDFSGERDPGVQSVRRIFDYYKSHGYDTIVMGASFRNLGEIEALAGCDRLTISPALLKALHADDGTLQRVLDSRSPRQQEEKQPLDESRFRWQLNEDAMATEKLAEGIRLFARDMLKLEERLKQY